MRAPIQKIHFIGIGGIGMSALARMCRVAGKEVSGSDTARTEITLALERLGVLVFYGHSAHNLSDDTALVVRTLAVPDDNPELLKAWRLGIPVRTYPEFLGAISKKKYTIAVSGTHGKTTTTGMIAEGAIAAGLSPTVIIGSILKNARSNFVSGKGKHLIAEACEYKRSFLNLSPSVLVITNIDNDHLDYYEDLADIQSAFAELAAKLPQDGFLICNANDERLMPVIAATKAKVINYGKYLTRTRPHSYIHTIVKIYERNDNNVFSLKVPGRHNRENAAAALAALDCLGVSPDVALGALNEFNGTWRRFEYKGETKDGAIVYDDYAHHPTEIKATLRAAREQFPDKTITVIFQPHLYSRTKLLFDEFTKSFADADEVYLAPVYAAREPKEDVSLKDLAQKIAGNGTTAHLADNLEEIAAALNDPRYGKNHLFITMGAGDIYKIADQVRK